MRSISHPTLPTGNPRVVLTELTVADAARYYAVLDRNRAHLSRYGDYQDEKVATADWVLNYFTSPPDDNIRYGVYTDGLLVGRVDLNPVAPPHYTIGYWLDHDHIGQGYATVGCAAAIDYARTLGATDIFAGVTHGNEPSVAVLRRLGFQPVADFPTYTRYRLELNQTA